MDPDEQGAETGRPGDPLQDLVEKLDLRLGRIAKDQLRKDASPSLGLFVAGRDPVAQTKAAAVQGLMGREMPDDALERRCLSNIPATHNHLLFSSPAQVFFMPWWTSSTLSTATLFPVALRSELDHLTG